jgi:hypothetical protein
MPLSLYFSLRAHRATRRLFFGDAFWPRRRLLACGKKKGSFSGAVDGPR